MVVLDWNLRAASIGFACTVVVACKSVRVLLCVCALKGRRGPSSVSLREAECKATAFFGKPSEAELLLCARHRAGGRGELVWLLVVVSSPGFSALN